MSPAAQIMKIKAEKTFFFLFNQRSKQEIKCLKAFYTSQELTVARRNGPF